MADSGRRLCGTVIASCLALAFASACDRADGPTPDPTPTDAGGVTTIAVDLDEVGLDVTVPTDHVVRDSALGEPSCVDSLVVVSLDSPGNVVFAAAAPGSACPDNQAINGAFPSWGAVDQLPDEAATATIGIEGATAYAFEVTYTECTNSCTDYPRQVTFVELSDGRTFFVVGRETDDDRYDAVVASIALRD